MKENHPQNEHPDTPDDMSQENAGYQANKKPTNTQNRNKKAGKYQRKTLWQTFLSQKPIKRLEIGIATVVAVAGLAYVGVQIWANLQTRWNFNAENRPRVVISRAPEFLGALNCEITDKAIYVHTGEMRIWLKNTGKGNAVNAFIGGPPLKLVPEKKTGEAAIDDIPEVSDNMCQANASSKMKMFPVDAGEEIQVDMVQAMGIQGLVKTNSISITIDGGPQKEPETPAGQVPEKVDIPKDALFQLYYPVCVYYFDEQGNRYGTCRSFRLVSNREGPSLGSPTFSCTQSPVTGSYQQTFGNFCGN